MTAILSMRIAVRTFAAYRQAIGPGAFTLDLPAGTTPGQVWSTLAERYPDLRRFPPPARFAVNDEFVGPEHALSEQDEVALIPPVSGGGGGGGAGPGGGTVGAARGGKPAPSPQRSASAWPASPSTRRPWWLRSVIVGRVRSCSSAARCASTRETVTCNSWSMRPTRPWPSGRCAASPRKRRGAGPCCAWRPCTGWGI